MSARREVGRATIRARSVDNDPALASLAFVERLGLLWLTPFRLEDGAVRPRRDRHQHYLFASTEADDLVLSEWRLQDGKLVNNRLRQPLQQAVELARADGARRRLAWVAYRLSRAVKLGRIARGIARLVGRWLPKPTRRGLGRA